jgi:iron complex outermembrane recepter protein
MRQHRRQFRTISVSIAAIAVAFAAPVFAQDADEEDPSGITDIIVTAQKRSEAIQDTPLAVSALDTRALEQSGVKDAAGLSALVPNVVVRNFNSQIVVATRGISNENTSNLGDASLAFHVNGVYVGRPRGAAALFYDVERVELLRGPQGTLYGRNSTAGALNLITKRPDMGVFEGGADISYGNYDAVIARGYLNVPVSDNFALRGALFYSKHDGYAINNVTTGLPPVPPGPTQAAVIAANAGIANIKNGDDENKWAGRLSALFEPSDNLSIAIVGNYQNTDEVGSVRSIISTPGFGVTVPAAILAFPGGPPVQTLSPGQPFLPQGQDPRNPRIYSLNSQGGYRVKQWDLTSEVNWSFADNIALTMVTGYRHDTNFVGVDNGGIVNLSNLAADGRTEQWSNELRIASEGSAPFQWLLGAYYFDEDQVEDIDVNNLGGGPASLSTGSTAISSQSSAAFGQISYAFSDSFKVFAGGRYSRDHKKRDSYTLIYGTGAPGSPLTEPATITFPPYARIQNNEKFKSFDWKVGFDYDITENSMFYASVGTGYRAGGFNSQNDLAYDPEELTAYEFGLKNDLLDKRLRLNLAAFYYDYTDLQVTAPREVNGQIGAFTANAANARIWGVEIEAVARPASWFSVDLTFGYTNSKFKDFQTVDNICTLAGVNLVALAGPSVDPRPGCVVEQRLGPDGVPVLIDPDGPGPAPASPVYDQVPQNFSGNRLANAPDITLNLGVTATLFDNNAGTLRARAAMRLVGENFLSEYNRSFDRVQSYTQSEARLTYQAENKRFLVEGFIQNIENNATPSSIVITASGVGYSFQPPRTYGLRVGVSF